MTKRLTTIGILALLLPALAAAEAEAAKGGATGFQLGARLGMGMPGGEYGEFAGSTAADEDQSLVVTAEGSFAIAEGLRLGAFATLMRPRFDTNYGRPQTVFLNGSGYRLDASILGFQLGVRAEVGLGKTSLLGFTAAPWGALAVGWERLGFSYDATLISGTGPASLSPEKTWSGFFGGVEAGVDVVASPAFAVGPYLSFLLGKYSTVKTSGTGVTAPSTSTTTWADRTVDIDSSYRAVHAWTTIGLRGRFDL